MQCQRSIKETLDTVGDMARLTDRLAILLGRTFSCHLLLQFPVFACPEDAS